MTPPPQSSSDSAAAPTATFDALAPGLSDAQQRIVDGLRADGIAVARFDELLDQDLWRDACADIAPFVAEVEEATRDVGAAPADKEEVIVRRFYSKRESARTTFAVDSPWLRVAASKQVLDVVNAYRGEQRWLFYVDNWYTVPYPNADARVASQRWHRDPEDAHVVKVFVYFSDVSEEAGPFEYMRGSPSGGRHGGLWPWEEKNRYVEAPELEAAIPAEERLTLTGGAGTIIFADTGGFHRGGFARTKPRILSTFTYLVDDEKKGKRRFDVDFRGRREELPPQVRFALE